MSETRWALSYTAFLDRLDYNLSHKVAILSDDRNVYSNYRVLNFASTFLEILGSSAVTIPIGLMLTLLTQNNRLQSFFLNVTGIQICNIVVIGMIKGLVKRERPPYCNKSTLFFVRGVDQYSFPSGHAVQMVAIAYMSYLYFDAHLILKGLVYLLCAVISTMRIIAGRHYIMDVLLGALIGIVCCKIYVPLFWIQAEDFPFLR